MINNYIKNVSIEYNKIPKNDYLYSLPIIKNLSSLNFIKPVTFFIGENGLGKSTLIEAIATKWGFNPEGGSINFTFSTKHTESNLYKYLHLIKGTSRPRSGYFLRSESLYNVATNIDELDSIECNAPPISDGYGGKSLHNQSHGESFLSIFFKRFRNNGLYILDEPESALSPISQMSLMVRIQQLVNNNSQFIIATHSPILIALPNSQVYEIKKDGIQPMNYRQTEHYSIMKNFFENTDSVINSLLT